MCSNDIIKARLENIRHAAGARTLKRNEGCLCVCVWCAHPFYVALDNAKNGRQYHFHICYSVFTHSQWPHSLSSCAVMWCIYELGDSSESKMLWWVGRGQFCNVCVCVGVSEYCPPAAKGNAASKAHWSNAILREERQWLTSTSGSFLFLIRNVPPATFAFFVWFVDLHVPTPFHNGWSRPFDGFFVFVLFLLFNYTSMLRRRNGKTEMVGHFQPAIIDTGRNVVKKNYIPFGHNRQK